MDWNRTYGLALVLAGAAALFVLARSRRGQELSSDSLEEVTVGVKKIVTAIVDRAKQLIAGEEGLRLEVYRDPGAGAWTIGWGHLVKPGERFHPYGPVKKITRAEADELFDQDLQEARDAVKQFVRVPLNDNQRAALESFVFNVGVPAFRQSTLLRKLNIGDYKGAHDQFDLWVYDDGKRIDGLAARRDREQEVFLA